MFTPVSRRCNDSFLAPRGADLCTACAAIASCISQEQEEHDDKLTNEVTGLIPEIKEKMRLLEQKQSSRDQLEIERAQVIGRPT